MTALHPPRTARPPTDVDVRRPSAAVDVVPTGPAVVTRADGAAAPTDLGPADGAAGEIVRLDDGSEVLVRPACADDPDDVEALRAFLAGLSADTLHQRFLTGVAVVPDHLLRVLLDADAGRRAVRVAVHGDRVVGHACCTLLPGSAEVADVGVVVADAHQGRGLGPRLVARAVRALPAARALELSVLATNSRSTRLVRRAWPDARPRFDFGVATYTVPAVPERPAPSG